MSEGILKSIWVYSPDERPKQIIISDQYYLGDQLIDIVIDYNNNKRINGYYQNIEMYGRCNRLLVTINSNGDLHFTGNLKFHNIGDYVNLTRNTYLYMQ